MSTTITPEERAKIRLIASRPDFLSHKDGIHDFLTRLLNALHAELAAAQERIVKLEAVKESAKVVDEWHHKEVHSGNGVQYVMVIKALHEALREAGEV